ncbi:hypothetical protein ACM66B_005619 [Microbotryomycetes sp. NB124-2]
MANERGPKELTHSSLPSFEAYVLVNGQRVDVYDIKQIGNKVIGYIESRDGAEFEVGYSYLGSRLSKINKAFDVTAMVDDATIESFVQKSRPGSSTPADVTVQGFRETPTTLQPLLFTKLSLTDNDELASQSEDFVRNVGSIQLRYRRIKDYVPSTRPSTFVQPAFQQRSLHEANKKAKLSHQAGNLEFLDPLQGPPFVQFEFRYCSRFLLEIENHLPAHLMPAPAPPARSKAGAALDLTADSDDEAARVDEIARLKKRLADLERDQKPDKKPKIENDSGSGKRKKSNVLETLVLN